MNIKKTIIKLIGGKRAVSESDALHGWKADAEDNIKGIKALANLDQLAPMLQSYQDVDQSKAWVKIKNKTTLDNQKSIFQLRNIAAIFILVIASWFAFYYFSTPVEKNAIVFVGQDQQAVTLDDGSAVYLEKDSKVTQLDFRSIVLDGIAYFDIAKNENYPFMVQLHHGKITVLGTEFSINSSANNTHITVTEGKVKLTFGTKEYLLTAGQGAAINQDGVTTIAHNFTPQSWKNKILKFENNSLHHVLSSVGVLYDLEIEWPENSATDGCKINTSFNNENITQIMNELALITGLKYELKDNKIIVKSYKC